MNTMASAYCFAYCYGGWHIIIIIHHRRTNCHNLNCKIIFKACRVIQHPMSIRLPHIPELAMNHEQINLGIRGRRIDIGY